MKRKKPCQESMFDSKIEAKVKEACFFPLFRIMYIVHLHLIKSASIFFASRERNRRSLMKYKKFDVVQHLESNSMINLIFNYLKACHLLKAASIYSKAAFRSFQIFPLLASMANDTLTQRDLTMNQRRDTSHSLLFSRKLIFGHLSPLFISISPAI